MIPELITELQSFGLRFQGQLSPRKGGAGPAEGGTFLISGIPVSLPISNEYVSKSPYVLREEGGQSLIFKDEKAVCPVHLIERPRFYDHSTEEGIPYTKIALLHGKDCLATSVIQTCIYWHSKERCQFCGIELSHKSGQTIKIKTPNQLSEVARKAKELDSIQHIVLTTGTVQPPGKEISTLIPCAVAIKEATDLPIHAQFCPPSNMEGLYELKEAGVDTVGIHIESFDFETLSQVAPAKAAMGLARFEKAWKMAVEIFGPNQVSSFLIAGLGEKRDSIIWGSKFLADLGVYPFVVPLRPIPGSIMENVLPPDPKEMKRIYEEVVCILKKKGLSASQSLAGCVRCGACSALSIFEEATDPLICHPVRTKAEQERAFEIRKEVFVLEQKIFSNSDIDENDPKSIHLVAEWNNQVVGTVRVFPVDNNGHWIGGRLAVKKEYRNTGAGELLVHEAIQCVKSRGCTKFTARIQLENVSFFSRVGWKTIEPVKDYFGRPHQLMEADLDKI
jgi:radical SAM protein (TIGR04043 family)/putative N-acetyltransferase (TIGR04045 family)